MKQMIENVKFDLKALRGDRKGVTALEYGVIAAAIIAVTIALFNQLGTAIKGKLSAVSGSLT